MILIWPITIDEEFRPAYLAETGEEIADSTPINEAETHYRAGSSRITTNPNDPDKKLVYVGNLQTAFPDVSFTEEEPETWVPKQFEDF